MGQLYGYRLHGPFDPAAGMRFDPEKVLLDPYGRGVVVPKAYNRDAARGHGDNAATAMKSVVVDPTAYDWEGDMPLRRPSTQTIVYEMHVKGFTRNPNSGVGDQTRETYRGLTEKIPYLQELGITALELLPVFQFDAQDCPPGVVNYWAINRCRSSLHIRHIVHITILLARSTKFATWSRHCIEQESKSSSTSYSITQPKEILADRRCVYVESTTARTSFSKKTAHTMPTTPDVETQPVRRTRPTTQPHQG